MKIEPELIGLSFKAYKAQNQAKLTYTATSTSNLKNKLSGLPAKESMLTDSYTSQVLRKDLYEEKMLKLLIAGLNWKNRSRKSKIEL